MADLVDLVAALLRTTAEEIVVPLFGTPHAKASEKGPGDWVTVADHEAEAVLAAELRAVLPGSTVVGEESVHADQDVLERLGGTAPVWLIDPVDGTGNYARGREPFAMIVALVQAGVTTHGWVYLPIERRMLLAEQGNGVTVDKVPYRGPKTPPERLRGIIPLPQLPADLADQVVGRSPGVADLMPSWACSGREYPDVVVGAADFVLSMVSMPWDHAAGALAVHELGGRAAYLDGEPYSTLDRSRRSLLVARSPQIWDTVRGSLLTDLA